MNPNDLNETLPNVLTVREVMDAARCSKSKTYRLIRTGQLPAVRIGRRLLVPRSVIVEMLTPKEAA